LSAPRVKLGRIQLIFRNFKFLRSTVSAVTSCKVTSHSCVDGSRLAVQSANLHTSSVSQRWLFRCNVIAFIAIKLHVEVNFNVKFTVQSVYKRSELCQSNVTYPT